jgi:hypothetical protein
MIRNKGTALLLTAELTRNKAAYPPSSHAESKESSINLWS